MVILHHLQTTVTLLIILSILVVAHEWGHFIVARIFGIRVDDFSIGFGKRLFRIAKRGDTEYNVRMLPLGGFVKIAGMEADEEPLVRAKDKVLGRKDDPDAKELPFIAENTPETTPYNAPDAFYSKPRWQRSLVILAGPVMSFLFGYVVICLIGCTTGWPTGKLLNKIDLVEPGGEGQHIGLRGGDVISAINGQPTTDGRQMVSRIRQSSGQTLVLTVQRGNKTLTLAARPRPALDKDNKPQIDVDILAPGALGAAYQVQPGDTLEKVGDKDVQNGAQAAQLLLSNAGKRVPLVIVRDLNPIELPGTMPAAIANSLPTLNAHVATILMINPASELKRSSLRASIHRGNIAIVNIFFMLGSLVHSHELQKSAGGIIYMYQATSLAVQDNPLKPENLFKSIVLAAQLSISLAIFNLFPIPILDGGHLLTFFIEWVRGGKKLTVQQQQAMMMTGLAIIATLFVLIFTNDILRTVRHQLPQ